MAVEGVKTVFDWIVVILAGFTFVSIGVVLITGNIINKRQAAQLSAALLETERLKQQLAWRTISAEQETKFLAAIPGAPPSGLQFSVTTVVGDAEGAQYGDAIAKILRKGGFSTPTGQAIFGPLLPEGVIIRLREQKSQSDKTASVLQQAFKAAGIDAPGELNPSMPDDSIVIVVGIKPRPKTDNH